MPVSLIAAVAANLVIGDAGRLPWRLPDDMARFKRLTLGHAVVMGRRTFDSMEKPLAGRRNIVLTRLSAAHRPRLRMAHTADDAISIAGEGELFVIGGAAVYELFLPRARRMYLTHVDAIYRGDICFPNGGLGAMAACCQGGEGPVRPRPQARGLRKDSLMRNARLADALPALVSARYGRSCPPVCLPRNPCNGSRRRPSISSSFSSRGTALP